MTFEERDLDEELWVDTWPPGPPNRPAFTFHLDLQNVPLEDTARIRATAESMLRRAGSGRALVRNAALYIAHLCSLRLQHPAGWAPASGYVVRVGWDPKDSADLVLLDRDRVVAWATTTAEREAGTPAAYVWGVIAEGFRAGPDGALPGT